MSKIKKVVITEFGDESKLAIVEAELPDPGAGEVQLTVDYSIVSGSDVNMRRGTYPFQQKAPLTPGYSVLGRVRVNGKGSSKFKVGDCVACLSKYEGQATLINLPEKFLVRVPEGVDHKEAVALVLDWVTAYQMLHHAAHVRTGQKIFVHGLSGGVGGALLSLGRIAGAQVFGTAAVSKHEEMRGQGAVPFDYSNKEWMGAMQGLGGVDAVFDPLGYESFDESYAILGKGGILVAYGMNLPGLTKTPGRAALPAILKLLAKNLLFWSGKRTTFYGLTRTSKNYKPDLELLFEWLRVGKLKVPIKAMFKLEEIQQAHREYARSAKTGSIILEVS
ncbi:MAG: medium chain dehydrogenase/reductase family protein [Granulicella sp.]